MCSEYEQSCDYDSIVDSRSPQEICDRAAEFIAEQLIASRVVTYQGDVTDPHEVVSVAVLARNRKIDEFLLEEFNHLGAIALTQTVGANYSLAMSA